MKSILKSFTIFAAVMGFIALVSVILLFPKSEAYAGDETLTVDFVAYSTVNPDFYAIVRGSKAGGYSLVINSVGNPAPLLIYPLGSGVTVEKALASKEVAPYGLTQKAVSGFKAPAGYALTGQLLGENLVLMLSAGDQKMNLGMTQVFTSPDKSKVAAIVVKNAHWSPDSTRVVIIIHQKLDGDWSVDADIVAAYKLG